MFRRGVSIIVMLGLVTGQLAALPHAHGASGQPSDHDARPHIHVSWFDHVGHCYDDGHHNHHHECDESHSQPTPAATDTGHDDHDSDAVYLWNDGGISLPTKSVGSPDSLQGISMLAFAVLPTPTALSENVADAYSPDECSPRCPLYLALRALRI